ncbi:alpha-glucoside transport system substrate-binding protein [Micromonospora nigra]|uniref:Alpha-glucoside transport system substrate-binding protein n=1 Tax=Micromonospora nigra TaxID=145857 RepID=A0A1C6SS33_9ACTN|nr:ABC transporter substrate-binding protein [Micromonospora nigra]SCL32308.1 alpha-glucoside transport system substrate-binding protein [Micromonospora nigra]
MTLRRGSARTALTLVTALLAGAGPVGCSRAEPAGPVIVFGSWTGDEEAVFRTVLHRFELKTGIRAEYQGHRDVSQVLQAGIERQRPPDVAVVPRLNDLQRYVNEDTLRPLDGIAGLTDDAGAAPQLIRVAPRSGPAGEPVGPKQVYAVAIATHLKSVFWYDPARLAELGQSGPPLTWEALVAQSRAIEARGRVAWCLGLSSPPVSGWPGTDWIEDILLHQWGQQVYEQWTRGDLKWDSPEVQRSWRAWGELLGLRSSRDLARTGLFSTWVEAGSGLFTSPAGCHLDHQGSFAIHSYRSLPGVAAPGRFDFFPTPPVGSSDTSSLQEVSDDVAAMFRDSSPARELMAYLASQEAQEIWRRSSGGLHFSRRGPADAPSTPVIDKVAARLGTGTLCRDGSDLMPAAMATAFERAVLVYVQQPDRLDALLKELDAVSSAVPRAEWMDLGCDRAAPVTRRQGT